jgi:5-methylcytosine-specific restriction endonuclease McrA
MTRWVPRRLRKKLLEQADECSDCGTDEGPFELDHIEPWHLGGKTAEENLRVVCQSCNRSKSTKSAGRVDEWVAAPEYELREIMNRALGRRKL